MSALMVIAGVRGVGRVAAAGAPSGPAMLFFSDWSTATGTSAGALNDGGKWDTNTPAAGEIVATTGLDFPPTLANCFEVPWDSAGLPAGRKTGLGVPSVGASRYYRFYFRLTQPDAPSDDNRNTHPFQDGNAAGDCNWSFNAQNQGLTSGVIDGDLVEIPAGKWQMRINTTSASGYGPNSTFLQTFLDKGVTYRVEIHLARLTTTTFNIHARVYNSSNTLLFGDADFQETDGTGTLADNPTMVFNVAGNLDGLNCGSNDTGSEPGTYAYEGAVAVSDVDWCGPYVLGNG